MGLENGYGCTVNGAALPAHCSACHTPATLLSWLILSEVSETLSSVFFEAHQETASCLDLCRQELFKASRGANDAFIGWALQPSCPLHMQIVSPCEAQEQVCCHCRLPLIMVCDASYVNSGTQRYLCR